MRPEAKSDGATEDVTGQQKRFLDNSRSLGRPLTAAEYADLERRLDALSCVRRNDTNL